MGRMNAMPSTVNTRPTLFIAFYPYASGLEVSREWLARMNWFKNWMWY